MKIAINYRPTDPESQRVDITKKNIENKVRCYYGLFQVFGTRAMLDKLGLDRVRVIRLPVGGDPLPRLETFSEALMRTIADNVIPGLNEWYIAEDIFGRPQVEYLGAKSGVWDVAF